MKKYIHIVCVIEKVFVHLRNKLINTRITVMSEVKQMQELLVMLDVISRLKIDLDRWISGCEKTSLELRDMGHIKEAENFDGQATAYWSIKNYLEVNGL